MFNNILLDNFNLSTTIRIYRPRVATAKASNKSNKNGVLSIEQFIGEKFQKATLECLKAEAVVQGCKKSFPRNFAKFTGKHLCQSFFFNKESLAQVFSCGFCEISKNTFLTEYVWWLLL